jgi:mannose-6-phosphate isomerase-like protein (cupin superfamily)
MPFDINQLVWSGSTDHDDTGSPASLVSPTGSAGSRTVHHIDLTAGGSTVVLRQQDDTVYYVQDGSGSIADPETGTMDPLFEGSMIFIDAGTAHQFIAALNGMVLLGGPRLAEPYLQASI